MNVQNWQTIGSRINCSSYRTQAKLMDNLYTVRDETIRNFRKKGLYVKGKIINLKIKKTKKTDIRLLQRHT
jgi:uncharacterized protein (UPF0218 family)